MLGRLLRIAVAACLLFAAWRTGQAYLAHYQFADEIDQIAQRGVRADEMEVKAAVAECITRRRVPLDPDQVSIRVTGEHVYIDARYTRVVEFGFGLRYPWEFTISAHGWAVPNGGARAL